MFILINNESLFRHEESGGGPLFVVHFIFIPLICCMDPDNAKVIHLSIIKKISMIFKINYLHCILLQELFVSTKHSKPYAVYKWMQQLCGER